MKPNVLFVDDEKDIVFTFERTFRHHYDIFTSNSPEKALEMLKELPKISVIISDYSMPRMNGIEFLSESINISPNSFRIMLTGFADVNTILDAINENKIYKFLLKPAPTELLKSVIDEAAHTYYLKEYEKEVIKLKSIFLSVITRNFKQPLTGILTSTYLLPQFLKQNKQEDFDNSIKLIQDSVDSMANQIDKILLITELDNYYNPVISIIDVNVYIFDLSSAVSHKNKKNNKIININESDKIEISTDPRILSVLLENLLDYCINSSNIGSDIRIETEIINTQFNFIINYSGPKILESSLDSLFKPYTDLKTPSSFSFFEIYLTISRKCVEILNGSMNITSEDENNQIIEISIPIK